MPDFKAFVRDRLGATGLPAEQEIKIVEELAGQIEEHYESLVESGWSHTDAWREVQCEVPDWSELRASLVDAAPSVHRLMHAGRPPLADRKSTVFSRFVALGSCGLVEDLRFGIRRARKDWAFALTTFVTLAICLGANAAIFTVVHSVLLKPLSLPEPERIVAFADQFPTVDPNFSLLNNARSYFDRPEAVSAVEDQAMLRTTRRAIVVEDRAEQTTGFEVTASFFRLVRTLPAEGRAFSAEDSEPGNEQVVILSHGLWQQAFGGDPAVLGSDLDLDGRPFTIVGVMPPDFSFFDPDARFWTPLTFTDDQRTVDTPATRLTYGFYHFGRLRPGADLTQAQAQIDALNAANLERFPNIRDIWVNTRFHTVVIPLKDALVGDVSATLYLLWGGAAFVLLIGAVNIVNLTLARATVRAREFATRLAVGASRAQVARLLTVESVALAGLGGVASLFIGAAILHAMQAPIAEMPGAERIRLDGMVVAFTLGSALLVGLLIGLGSATSLRSMSLSRTIADGDKGGSRGRTARVRRRWLVVGQIGISFVLLVVAGLLLASFRNLLRVDPGFDAGSVITAALSLPTERYANDEQISAFTERFLGAIRAIGGVASAGVTSNLPMGTSGGWGPILAEDYVAASGESVVSPWRIEISPGYLETMGTTLLRGRLFDERDRADTEPVMLIDEGLARRFWGERDPLGTRMFRPTYPDDLNRKDENTEFYRVVGIVRHVEFRDLAGKGGRAFGAFYRPYAQSPNNTYYVAIEAVTEPEGVMEQVRAALGALDPQLPLFDVQTMINRTDLSLASRKLAVGLAATFGVIALLLAALGIYGVLVYLVTQRQREIAIRMALGSSSVAVFALVLGEGLRVTAAGLALGLVGAVAVSRGLREQVFGIEPTDPLVLAVVAVISAAIALLACMAPARRATRVEPVAALGES